MLSKIGFTVLFVGVMTFVVWTHYRHTRLYGTSNWLQLLLHHVPRDPEARKKFLLDVNLSNIVAMFGLYLFYRLIKYFVLGFYNFFR